MRKLLMCALLLKCNKIKSTFLNKEKFVMNIMFHNINWPKKERVVYVFNFGLILTDSVLQLYYY